MNLIKRPMAKSYCGNGDQGASAQNVISATSQLRAAVDAHDESYQRFKDRMVFFRRRLTIITEMAT